MTEKTPPKKRRFLSEQEKDARRGLLEELFWDLHQSRKQIYWMNFVRGIFFGVGSVFGGTLVVALLITILGVLVDVPGGVGDFVQYIIDIVQKNNQ
jgi:hypothetical protein